MVDNYPTAIVVIMGIITICLSILKIVTITRANGKSNPSAKNNPGPSQQNTITRKDLDDVLDKKLSNVMYLDTCLEVRRSYEKQLSLISEHLSEKIDTLSLALDNGLKEVKKEFKNHREK